MSVNGITGVSANAYETLQTTQAENTKPAEETKDTTEKGENGVVYEPSKDSATVSTKKYVQNTELINKLKAENEEHSKQLRNIVEQLMTKQSQTYGVANDMWKFLASGKFEVDAATKAQAQEDVSEDGYWGVKQTSSRILDFATALTGGDPSKIEDMREAFKKGYKQAEKTWGGELPEISKQTYDAVMAGFDKMAEEAGVSTTN
ncbi:MAG: hypothetical protein NC302_12060 [Bacteroidales bacterium]|nr:hypothetical protein [Bacteroidales bacterium]MCM1415729.1 hypothetical protein [bacterium]MCM1423683.1 hypothetical protein [bacterium]